MLRRAVGVVVLTAGLTMTYNGIMEDVANAAPSKACVNKSEFAKVKPGMKAKRVHRFFETKGKVSYLYEDGTGYRYVVRVYKVCKPYKQKFSHVEIDFQNGRVSSYSASWAKRDWTKSG